MTLSSLIAAHWPAGTTFCARKQSSLPSCNRVRMRWEPLEQQSERERESVLCIRIEQTRREDTVNNRQTSVMEVEEDILTLVNLIREQCFQQAETFISGDIRYQGFEDQDGLGKGMITIRQRGVEVFEIDIALGCLLGFVLGNGIQANSGRAYKWCPFWGQMGITTVRVTAIARANDYYSKSRIPVTFGSQISGHKGWDMTNPKERMVRRMLQLLQQRAGSGPVLALLRMPAWEPHTRMFKKGQSSVQGEIAQETPATPGDRQKGAAREKQRCAMSIWWRRSVPVEIRKSQNNKIGRLLRWTLVTRGTMGESTRKYLLTRKQEYLILEGDRAGANAVTVIADQHDTVWEMKERRYWGVWAEAAERVSAFWQAQEQSTMTHGESVIACASTLVRRGEYRAQTDI